MGNSEKLNLVRAPADALRSQLETILLYWPVSGYATNRAKHILWVLETKPVHPAMLCRYTKELNELGFPIEPLNLDAI